RRGRPGRTGTGPPARRLLAGAGLAPHRRGGGRHRRGATRVGALRHPLRAGAASPGPDGAGRRRSGGRRLDTAGGRRTPAGTAFDTEDGHRAAGGDERMSSAWAPQLSVPLLAGNGLFVAAASAV